ERITAIGRAGGLHIEHILDAIDLLLDGERDGFDEGLGVGAGIVGGHLDGRRGDRRILSDGQIENGHAAQQHSDARDDIREHRAFYEEFSEHLFHALALFVRSAHVWRMTKKAGTKRTARQVEANIPLATAMPRERRALAPAPLASTSGSTPRMKVKEVI